MKKSIHIDFKMNSSKKSSEALLTKLPSKEKVRNELKTNLPRRNAKIEL